MPNYPRLSQRLHSRGQSLLYVVLWLGLAALVWLLVDRVQHPNTLEQVGKLNVATLKRGPDGHYSAEALINGERVRVLVDTGATGVAISQHVADRLGLASTDAINTHTANGNAVSYLVRLKTVQLGGIVANDVAATITPGLEGDALLGMSFLGRMDVRLYRGVMTIRDGEDSTTLSTETQAKH
ncbi:MULTISPECIES: TIGR02281 family clan AA aspartic protease [unclassified Methylophilus]|uniref:retropepsin-like aspartic protease family protein n=1 Tax=unclassified Methylophilus TaxID=2630143 RepID=UPI0006FC15AB|nr:MULTISPECIES: retropepsin-like aspartic protease [unclassified Methylophilus]KQT41787.1 peptidase A2 [Methylophilus sp. Leaf416]KQT55953.1 peptidase A2 [Methylophilus sp. Leaf459]